MKLPHCAFKTVTADFSLLCLFWYSVTANYELKQAGAPHPPAFRNVNGSYSVKSGISDALEPQLKCQERSLGLGRIL